MSTNDWRKGSVVRVGALSLLTIASVSLLILPVVVASSSGSDYPIETIRAHTAYITAQGLAPVQRFLPTSTAPDVTLGRQAVGATGVAQTSLLQAAGLVP